MDVIILIMGCWYIWHEDDEGARSFYMHTHVKTTNVVALICPFTGTYPGSMCTVANDETRKSRNAGRQPLYQPINIWDKKWSTSRDVLQLYQIHLDNESAFHKNRLWKVLPMRWKLFHFEAVLKIKQGVTEEVALIATTDFAAGTELAFIGSPHKYRYTGMHSRTSLSHEWWKASVLLFNLWYDVHSNNVPCQASPHPHSPGPLHVRVWACQAGMSCEPVSYGIARCKQPELSAHTRIYK